MEHSLSFQAIDQDLPGFDRRVFDDAKIPKSAG